MISSIESAPGNLLLSSLPPGVLKDLEAKLQPVQLELGSRLYDEGGALPHVYFPVTAVVSLYSSLPIDEGVEVAMVGSEGVVGVCAFLGGRKALSGAVVQRGGSAWRMSAADIADLAREVEPLRAQLLRYTQVLFTHMAQTSVCLNHHALASQLCRCLLQHLDRQSGDELEFTQMGIADLLGVRREAVTQVACRLQRDGLIRYARGRIQIVDRRALELQCCE